MSKKMKSVFIAVIAAAAALISGACGLAAEVEASTEMISLGKYTPDDPAPWELDPESNVHDLTKENRADLKAISARDKKLFDELRQDYQTLTVQQFLKRFKEQTEKSNTFNTSAANLSYQAMYDPMAVGDDFYISLYFTQQEYYQTYGPGNIRDISYSFGYYRYLGDPDKPYDLMAEISAHYELEIVYPDKTALTVKERDQQIAATITKINKSIDTLPKADWSGKDIKKKLEDLVKLGLKANSDKIVQFELLDLYTWTDSEE